jgi:hypothetical protein
VFFEKREYVSTELGVAGTPFHVEEPVHLALVDFALCGARDGFQATSEEARHHELSFPSKVEGRGCDRMIHDRDAKLYQALF